MLCASKDTSEVFANGKIVKKAQWTFTFEDDSGFVGTFVLATVDPEALDAYTVGTQYDLAPVRRGN